MNYETGISTGPADLIGKLSTFAAANGWTVNPATGGSVFSKGAIYVGVAVDATNIYLRGALSYDGGSAWNAQPNNSGVSVTVNTGAGPFTAYHFFAGEEQGSEHLHVAIQYAAGKYRHLSFGSLVKHGSYSGSTYVDGVFWNSAQSTINFPDSFSHSVICDANATTGSSHVWADYDGKVNNWQRIRTDTGTGNGIGSVRSNGINNMFPWLGYERWNLRNVTAPLIYFLNRDANLRSPAGRIPNMRQVGMHNIQPGTMLSIGGVNWLVLPIVQRTETWNANPSSIESSGQYGYAYKLPAL